WLRRHAGPVSRFNSAAREMETMLRRLDLVQETDRILEIGCGCGAMIPAFGRLLGPAGGYVGFDVHGPSISWCRRQFGADRRFHFELAWIASPYGQLREGPAAQAYRFPMDDADADFIIAKSVVTHLLIEVARQYLRELRRPRRPD